MWKVAAVCGLLLVPAVDARAAKTITIAPYSPWNVDYGDKVCSLRRGFGTKEQLSVIIMHRFGPTNHFAFTVISDEFKSFNQGQSLMLRFGGGKPRRIDYVVPSQRGKGKATLFFANQSLAEPTNNADDNDSTPVTPSLEAATDSVSVTFGGRERIFKTGPLDKAFAALRACTDNLVATWGLDPKQQAQLSKRVQPLTSPAYWLKSSDYPKAMLGGGKQALVNFRLSVDRSGMPSGCEVQTSYNDKEFDRVTCELLLKRARFTPALDANGAAVPSFYLNTVRWIMQG